jgi:hypothetical protein
MTPTGKDMVEQGYPELYFNWEKGWTDLKYNRLDLLALYQQESILGQTGLRVYGGYVGGDSHSGKPLKAEVWLGRKEKSFYERFNLTTYWVLQLCLVENISRQVWCVLYQSPHSMAFKSFGQNTSSFDLFTKVL